MTSFNSAAGDEKRAKPIVRAGACGDENTGFNRLSNGTPEKRGKIYFYYCKLTVLVLKSESKKRPYG